MSNTVADPTVGIAANGAPTPSLQKLRWEWRVFARDLSQFPLLADVPTLATEAWRQETYLLSKLSRQNVKVRNGILEIKQLEATDPRGLELWRPTLAGSFPLTPDAVATVLAAWGMPQLFRPTRCYEFADLLRNVVTPNPALRAVEIQKQRTRLALPGCSGERVSLNVDGKTWETLAFENVDPAQVRQCIARLGLADLVNENYPAALKAIVGFANHTTLY